MDDAINTINKIYNKINEYKEYDNEPICQELIDEIERIIRIDLENSFGVLPFEYEKSNFVF